MCAVCVSPDTPVQFSCIHQIWLQTFCFIYYNVQCTMRTDWKLFQNSHYVLKNTKYTTPKPNEQIDSQHTNLPVSFIHKVDFLKIILCEKDRREKGRIMTT